MPIKHVAQILQGLTGYKLIGIHHIASGGGGATWPHFQKLVTGANVHRHLAVFQAVFRVLTTDILWTIQNTESHRGGIEYLGKSVIIDAVRRDAFFGHLKQTQG